ncbi:hypothetical protein E3N88_09259 [Mikania micrantha]|uniref:O-methyltransferase domain-containing protein n=1 Tax=Mikania micrantha TaxID=192012 RepID=A0A5N6PKU1_9ASTR|nr:hypothetical protein E3N88_09259 [Mikania micrantha]
MARMATQEGDEQSRCLLQSQAHIYSHVFGFINSMTLKCAIELQIPDIINSHGRPMMLSELVEALSINKEKSHFVYRLMRMLVHSGFFEKQSVSLTRGNDEEEEEGYLLTPASKLFLKEDPLCMRPFVLSMLDPTLMDPWQHMGKWFQTDDLNPFQTATGRSLWDFASQEPMLNKFFNEAMSTDARLVAKVILKDCRCLFEGVNSIVDVGGGTGNLAKSIAEAFPNISCICFDLPHVVKGLDGSKNFRYVAGDMFEAIPKADVILMKWILHDWNDEECIKILTRCKEAIPSKNNGGKVIIMDIVPRTILWETSKSQELYFPYPKSRTPCGRPLNSRTTLFEFPLSQEFFLKVENPFRVVPNHMRNPSTLKNQHMKPRTPPHLVV